MNKEQLKALYKRMAEEYVAQEKEARLLSPSYDQSMRSYYRLKKHLRYGSRTKKVFVKRASAEYASLEIEGMLRQAVFQQHR